MDILLAETLGHACRLTADGELEIAPLMADGTVAADLAGDDGWYEPDYERILPGDADAFRRVRHRLRLLAGWKAPNVTMGRWDNNA